MAAARLPGREPPSDNSAYALTRRVLAFGAGDDDRHRMNAGITISRRNNTNGTRTHSPKSQYASRSNEPVLLPALHGVTA
jgi:hypothetical protein